MDRQREGPLSWAHPTGCRPKRIHLVALGNSSAAYVRHQLTKGLEQSAVVDEVWTFNRGIRLFEADLAFVLDEIEPEARKDPAYGAMLRRYEKPIISTRYTDLVPSCHVYPGPEILDSIEKRAGVTDPYWHNSVPMALAYAWFIGVQEVTLWGADYTLPNGQVLEDARANCEFWIGWLRACGVRVGVPLESTLMNTRQTGGELRIYGLLDQSQAPGFFKRGES